MTKKNLRTSRHHKNHATAPALWRLAAVALLTTLVGTGRADTAVSTAQPNVRVLPALTMEALQRKRIVRIYLPPSYHSSQRRYPVLYMHDGQNLFDDATSYAGEWGVDETLNKLAESHDLELIVVGIDHGGDHRITELNPFDHDKFGPGRGEAYLEFVVEQLKPLIDRQYRTLPDRDHTGIMGSSMGGLISHYAVSRYPQVFGRAGIFSPAYWVGPRIFDMPIPSDARIYLLIGGREGDKMVEDFTTMNELLELSHPRRNRRTKLVAEGEHNEAFWRAELAEALLWLFAPSKNFATGSGAE